MPTLNIVFDGRFLSAHYPGIGRYAFNLLLTLPAAMPDAKITALVGEPDPRFPQSKLEGLSPKRLTMPVRSLGEQLAVPRELGRLGADLFHSPYFVTPYRTPCPRVVTVHDTLGLSPEALPSLRARLAFRVANHLALRGAQAVITVSEASRRDLMRDFGVPREKITVIAEAADPALRPASGSAVAQLRETWRLPERYALFVGANKPHKNLLRLLEAWAEIGEGACPLVLAGRRDPRFPEPEEQARRLSLDARFLGEVPEPDLPALYTGAEILVMPSLREGFGLPVVEAMACGTPVACSNVSSLPEVAADAAVFFDPRKTASMAKALGRLLNDGELRRNLSRRGQRRAAEFSWRLAAEQTAEVYRRVLTLSHSGRSLNPGRSTSI